MVLRDDQQPAAVERVDRNVFGGDRVIDQLPVHTAAANGNPAGRHDLATADREAARILDMNEFSPLGQCPLQSVQDQSRNGDVIRVFDGKERGAMGEYKPRGSAHAEEL
jgi:hypothetical protein